MHLTIYLLIKYLIFQYPESLVSSTLSKLCHSFVFVFTISQSLIMKRDKIYIFSQEGVSTALLPTPVFPVVAIHKSGPESQFTTSV